MRKISSFGIQVLAIFLFCMATNCNSSSGSVGQNITKSSIHRETKPQVSDADLAAVVSANTEFALKVFPLLDTTPNNNTFFSPYSVVQAFSLLEPGARGTTLSEINQALAFPLPQDRLNPALNKLDLLIAGKTSGATLPNGYQAPKLNNANAVWGQQGLTILPAYLDTIAINHGAGLHLVDFRKATERSRQTINSWVEEQTNNRIQNLIPQNGVSSDTRIVLTNAVWFKANWATQFADRATANRTFNKRDGLLSTVPFMSKRLSLNYVHLDGCQGVDIPYAGNKLSMLVVMPDAGNFDPFLLSLTPKVIRDITNHLTQKEIAFSMPKFSFTRASEMHQILKHLGMNEAFNPAQADFSGIDGKHDLFIGAVFHKAFIDVNEEGTEAAAATAISMLFGSAMPPPPDLTLTIDRPFIFLIHDRQTDLILFMGKVVSL